MHNETTPVDNRVSLESVMLQFHDHQRVISKSMSALADITTQFYNEIVTRQQQIEAAKTDGTEPAPAQG